MITGIIIGLIIGAPLGMIISGLMIMASRCDELEEEERDANA